MSRTQIEPRSNERLSARSTIAELANNSLLDALALSELVVYLRLLRAQALQKTRRLRVINIELYRDSSTAVRALQSLEKMGLIKVHYADGRFGRTVEVR